MIGALISIILLWSPAQSAQQLPTLKQVLSDNNVENIQKLPQDLLSTTISGYAFDGDARESVLAFFDPAGKLHVALLDRASARWQHATVGINDAAGAGNSILKLKRTGRYIYVDSHINPSAGRLIVLSRDLKLRRALYGWEVAVFPDETIVYHHSQTHFAPTHPLEMSVFNPTTLQEKQIYPPDPAPQVRVSFMDRVNREYKKRGEAWFSAHNHHMNPELFDSNLIGDVMVNAAAKSMTFLVRFGDPENAGDPLPFSEQVRVTCSPIDRVDQIQCSEELVH